MARNAAISVLYSLPGLLLLPSGKRFALALLWSVPAGLGLSPRYRVEAWRVLWHSAVAAWWAMAYTERPQGRKWDRDHVGTGL